MDISEMQKICNEAIMYYKKGQIKKAINLFTQAANNNYLPAIKDLTSHYLLKTDNTCDISKYILKLASYENDGIAMRNVGLYKFTKEHYFDALQLLKKAEKLGCQNLNYRIALCHMALCDYKSAIKLFHTVESEELISIECFCGCNCLELNRNLCSCDPVCKINYLKLFDPTKFNNLRNLAIKVYNCIGQCYKNLEEYLTAIEYFEKSLSKGNVAILFELYHCHLKLGNLYFAGALVQKIKESGEQVCNYKTNK
jgi:tetratricopeptide (TPR) repeat protein